MEKIPEFNLKKPENVAEVETDAAKYDIVYSLHNRPVNPQAVEKSDAIILELIGNYQTEDMAGKQLEHISKEQNTNHKIIKFAAENQKPVYLVDMSIETFRKHNDLLLKAAFLPVIESMAGAGLVFSGVKSLVKKNELTRRDFLKSGAKIGVAAYLALPEVTTMLIRLSTNSLNIEPDESSVSRRAEKISRKVVDAIHPELYSNMDTRNDLIAQKSEAVARLIANKLGRKPQLSLVIGSSHTGIENSLKSDLGERVGRLKKDLGPDASREKIIVRIDFEPKEGNTPQKYSITFLEDPSLK